MAISLSQIRVEASLDASSYVAGARAKTAADAQMVAGADKVSSSLEQTERRLSQSSTALERLTRSIDPAYSAQQKLEAGQQTLQRAFDAGIIKQDEFSRRLDLLRDKYSGNVASLQSYATALNSISEVQQRINAVATVKDDNGYASRVKDIQAYGAELDSLRAKYSPLFAAQQAYARAQTDVNNAFKVGALSEREHFDALSKTKDVYDAQVATLRGAASATGQHAAQLARVTEESRANADAVGVSTRAFGLNRQGLQELQAAGVNSFQALASGMSVWRVAQAEGAQVLGAFVQGGVLSFRTIASWSGVFGAVAAGVGVFIAAVARAVTTEQQIKNFQLTLDALGTSGKASGESLQSAFEHIRDSGSAAADALAAVQVISRNPIIDPSQAEDLIKLARDIGAVTGEALPAATEKLVSALAGGRGAIIDYAFSLNSLTADQAKQIRETNDLSIAIDAISSQFAGKFQKSLSPAAEAMAKLSESWNGLIDAFSKSSVVTSLFAEITNVVNGLRNDIEAIERVINSLGSALDRVGKFISGSVGAANKAAGLAQQDLASALKDRGYSDTEIARVLGGGPTPTPASPSTTAVPSTGAQPAASPPATAAESAATGVLSYASPAEQAVLAQIQQRENFAGSYNTFHATGQTVGSLADVTELPGKSHAFGLYGFQPGTYTAQAKQLGFDPNDISAENQRAAALNLLRQVGPNASSSWQASGAAVGRPYPTAGLEVGGAGFGQTTTGQLPAQKQLDIINQEVEANARLNQSLREQGATAQATTAFWESYNSKQSESIGQENRLILAWQAYSQVLNAADIEQRKAADAADRLAQGQATVNDAFKRSEADGLRAQAVLTATTQVYDTLGNSADHSALVQQKAGDALRQQALLAVQSSEAQVRGIDRTTVANQALAAASAQGVAAVKDQEIANQAASQTFDVLAKAQASYDQAVAAGTQEDIRSAAALLDRAKAQDEQVRAQLRANDAARQTTQLNLRAEDLKQQTQVVELQASLQGKTSAEISKQILLLRTKQDLETRFKDASDEAKQNLLGQTEAIANANIKLEQQRVSQARMEEEVRQIADTITNSIGSAIDDVLSGKKIEDWGQRFKDILRSVASTIIQTEIIKPLIGTALSQVGLTNVSQQFGTVGQSNGILGNIGGLGSAFSGIGKIFGLGDTAGATAVSGARVAGLGTFGGELGTIGDVASAADFTSAGGGGLFSGLSSIFGGGSATAGAAGAAEGIGGALSGIAGVASAAIPYVGAAIAIGSVIAGLFGNKKPSNNAGGLLLDLGSGKTSDAQGSGANLGVAQQIGSALATFERDLLKQIPGATLPSGNVNIVKGDQTGITTAGAVSGKFASAQDAITAIETQVIQGLSGVSDTLQKVLSQVSDPSQLQAAIAVAAAYDNVGTSFDKLFANISADSVRKIGPFEAVLNQINDQFEALTQSAQKYGLSLEPINQSYQSAKDRLATDFNETISRAMEQLQNPRQSAIADERRAGEQRVQDAKAVGADLAAVEAYNSANLKKLTDDVAKAADDAAKAAATLTASIKTSFESAVSGVVNQVGPFERAFNAINDNLKKLTDQATASGRRTDDVQLYASAAQQQVTGAFNENIGQLLLAITSPAQAAIETERRAGERRVQEANAVSGDLDAVAKFNVANLAKVTEAAKNSVDTLSAAEKAVMSASSTFAAAISNVTTGSKGPFGDALDALRKQFATLFTTAVGDYQFGNLSGLQGSFSTALDSLKDAFNKNIQSLTLGLSDPFQAALNAELQAGQDRVRIAQSIGADINTVDEYNRQSLLAVAKAAATATDALATAAGFNRDVAQQILAIKDPLAAALQAELDAGQKRIDQARQTGGDISRVEELNRLKLLQVAEATTSSTDALDKFTSRLQSLQGALSQLTAGPLSGLTPAQTVTASSANFDRLLGQVKGGNLDLIPELSQAGTQAVQTSQQVYGNSKQTADLRAKITKALEDVASQTGREASNAAATVTVTAANQEQIKSSLRAQATAARQIADYTTAQAEAAFKRTGVENEALATQAANARAVADQLESQLSAVASQTIIQNQIVASLSEQFTTQSTAARAVAAELQKQADIEFARTGIRNNIYQQEADGATAIAKFLDIQANAQNLSVDALRQSAAEARAIADQLQVQADADLRRTGVKNTLLQDEADAARYIGTNLDKQAQSQGQLTDTDASRVKLAIALLQQDAANVAAATQANQPTVATGFGTPEQQTAFIAAAQQQASDVAGRITNAQAGQPAAAQQQKPSSESSAAAAAPMYLLDLSDQQSLNAYFADHPESRAALDRLLRFSSVSEIATDQASVPALIQSLETLYHYTQLDPRTIALDRPITDTPITVVTRRGFAGGTGNTPPGWIQTGEQGPEWFYQNGGNKVLPYGVSPPAAANDDLVAELRKLQFGIDALIRQMQGGQVQANRDARMIAEETATVSRKIAQGAPARRNVG